MKKIVLLLTALLGFFTISGKAQTVTLNVFAAQLLTSGSTAVPDNMLVQLISSPSSTFTAPTATSFTGGNAAEAVLFSGTVSTANSGDSGGFFAHVQLTLGQYASEEPGDWLLLRWYPTLGINASVPGGGVSYGQFNNNGSTSVDENSDIDWQIPSSGATDGLEYESVSEGGDQPNSAGVANLSVAAVPEPASLSAIAGAFAIGAMALRRRRK